MFKKIKISFYFFLLFSFISTALIADPSEMTPPSLETLTEKNLPEEITSMLTAQEEEDDLKGGFNYWEEFSQMLYSLGVIVLILLLGAWLLRRFVNRRVLQVNLNNKIKIIERRLLTQKSSLYLIEVQNKTLLIGDSHSGIRLLTEYETDNIDDALPLEKEKTSFSEIFKRLKKQPQIK